MWWWPFKKREAAQAESDFKDSLSQALLRQDDLIEATERLRQGRKERRRGTGEVTLTPLQKRASNA
jgi:hypothetical protein